MRENNGIIWGILATFFPGAMRLFSIFPRWTFFMVAALVSAAAFILYIFRETYQKGWQTCVPIIVISLVVGLFSYQVPEQDLKIDAAFTTPSTLPEDLIARADSGDVDAQLEIVMSLMTSRKEDGKYVLTNHTDLATMNKYAQLAAENNSAKGYMLSGIMKSHGFGSPILKNQAIDDFIKSIELDPGNLDAYSNLLGIKDLEETHPDIYAHYYAKVRELLLEKEYRKKDVIDSLAALSRQRNLDKETLEDYLTRHDATIQEAIPENPDLLVYIMNLLTQFRAYDRFPAYTSHIGKDKQLSMITVLPHIKTWELDRYSTSIDSLLVIASDPMLSEAQAHSDLLELDPYQKASISLELSERKLEQKEYDPKTFAQENRRIDASVKGHIRQMKPVIKRRNHEHHTLKDSTKTLGFKVQFSYTTPTEGPATSSHQYTTLIRQKGE